MGQLIHVTGQCRVLGKKRGFVDRLMWGVSATPANSWIRLSLWMPGKVWGTHHDLHVKVERETGFEPATLSLEG
jgi:hypothetical protein